MKSEWKKMKSIYVKIIGGQTNEAVQKEIPAVEFVIVAWLTAGAACLGTGSVTCN